MTSAEHLVRALAEEYPRVLRELDPHGVLRPTRCILATKVGHKVLEYFGVASTPLAVDMVVGNRCWWEWWSTTGGSPPGAARSSMPDGAWAVGAVQHMKCGNDGYDGHVLLHVPALATLLDLDFQQFARPARGIDAAEVMLLPLPEEGLEPGVPVVFTNEDGAVIHLVATGRRDWRSAPDWRRWSHREIIGPIIRRLKHLT